MRLPDAQSVPIETVRPYENNPRRITPEAVEAVRTSIEEFGYVQPILVDDDGVIVAGHTRYQALLALGYTQVEVYRASHLSPEQARQYRLVDNRTAELTDWAHDKLVAEAREMEERLLRQYFADLDLDIGTATASGVTEAEIEAGQVRTEQVTQAPPVHTTDVRCPSCMNVFQVKTATLPGLNVEDLDALLTG